MGLVGTRPDQSPNESGEPSSPDPGDPNSRPVLPGRPCRRPAGAERRRQRCLRRLDLVAARRAGTISASAP